MNTGRLPAVANPPDDDAETGDNHDDDSGDFKEREPELQLTEYLHAHQVYGLDGVIQGRSGLEGIKSEREVGDSLHGDQLSGRDHSLRTMARN